MITNKKIARHTAELLLDINAISVQPDKPFTFTSGVKSPIYIDNRYTISFPKVREQIVDYYVQVLKQEIGLKNIDLLSGTSTAAIPWAAFIAQKMKLPMVYVRGKKKGHGKQRQIEGKIEPGQKTVVVEDHISTGGSLIENATAVRQEKAEVKYAIAATTFLFKEATKKFKKEKIQVITLTDFKTIIDIAVERGLVKKEDKATVLEWNKNPRAWGVK